MTAASPPALLPCPFCGNPGSLFQKRPWSDDWRVCCDQNEQGQCPAFGDYSTPEEAIAAWNRRDGTAELVEALRLAMQRLNESGTGEMGLIDTIHETDSILRSALAKHGGGT